MRLAPADELDAMLRLVGITGYLREHRFAACIERRWRADFAWPNEQLIVEVDGAVWVGGRHTRGAGFTADCEKLNMATELGWRVLRYTTGMVRSGSAVKQIKAVLGGAGGESSLPLRTTALPASPAITRL